MAGPRISTWRSSWHDADGGLPPRSFPGPILSEFRQTMSHDNRSRSLRAWFRPPQNRAGLPLDWNRSPNNPAEPPLDRFPPPHDRPLAGEDRKGACDASIGLRAVLTDLRMTLRNSRTVARDLRNTVQRPKGARKGLFEPPDASARPCGTRFRSRGNRNQPCVTSARPCGGCHRSCGDRSWRVGNGLRQGENRYQANGDGRRCTGSHRHTSRIAFGLSSVARRRERDSAVPLRLTLLRFL